MAEQTEKTTQSNDTPGNVLGQMGQELADALRREVEQLRDDMSERLSSAAKGGRSLALAGAFGGVAAAAVGTLPLIALRRILPSWALALLIGGGAAALAAHFARQGLEDLGELAPIDAERVKDAAKNAMRPSAS